MFWLVRLLLQMVFSSAIDTAKLQFDAKVVERLVELPDVIQEMLLI